MRWTPGGTSRNVEDRRGSGLGMPVGIGGSVILLVLSLIFGRDFLPSAGDQTTQQAPGQVGPVQQTPEEATEVQFVSFVLDTAQTNWAQLLPDAMHTPWHDAKLVLFRDATQTGCGTGQTAMGPFYCPLDERIYIDLAFYDELRSRFGAPGDFAQAYVITHELGHHVQHLLGTDEQVRRAQEARPEMANALSVRLELQADCYAGVWGHASQQERILEPGDIEEGLNAAAAVGDDRIQRRATGHVNTDTFTHGSSAQRVSWFKKGFASGDPRDCDTFAGL
ncbi:MAG TPA: neutral zinc metallopeptidase [Gemmatimonadaceae bacterium]|jgi:predicted metalloprotease|nr:neutral zinc metallopeptidase [Gemmatimonadaceae bacterium]